MGSRREPEPGLRASLRYQLDRASRRRQEVKPQSAARRDHNVSARSWKQSDGLIQPTSTGRLAT